MNESVAKVASEIVGGLRGSPLILGILVLNAFGIGAGVWFLSALATAQQARWDLVLKACLPKVGG